MKITANVTRDVNIEVISNDDTLEIVDYSFECNDATKEIIITYQVKVKFQNTSMYNVWEFTKVVSYDEIMETNAARFDSRTFDYRFVSSSITPKNIDDILPILVISGDTTSLGIDLSDKYVELIKKDNSLIEDFNELISKANYSNTYDVKDLAEFLKAAEAAGVINVFVSGDDFSRWEKYDATIAKRIINKLQAIVEKDFDPNIDNGLDDFIFKSVVIIITIN